MIPLYSSQAIREWDAQLIVQGFPSHTLMELAGKGVADFLHRKYPHASIAIYCGSGNNGGDGYVLARWLHLWGHNVALCSVSPPKTTDSICNAQLYKGPSYELLSMPDCDITIDALLGTGQDRPPSTLYAEAVQEINLQKNRGSVVYALDIPTGIHPDLGYPLGDDWVEVDGCFSFGKSKESLFRNADMGEIIEIDIGFDLLPHPPLAHSFLLEQRDIINWWPKESSSMAKWNRGHVAIIARGGAAVLAAQGAFVMGAGLVSVVCSESDWNMMHGMPPEVMRTDKLDIHRHDSVVLGPGITEFDDFCSLWNHFPKPMVVDAGGLSLLAQQKPPLSEHIRVLTPHSAEAARLLGTTKSDVEKDTLGTTQKLQSFGFSLLKGPYTKIGSYPMWIAPRGSVRLATAGSGDILVGLIGALLAKGLSAPRAAAIACYLHATSGEQMKYFETASDLIQRLRETINCTKSNSML